MAVSYGGLMTRIGKNPVLSAAAITLYLDFGFKRSDADFLITQCVVRYSKYSKYADSIGIQRSRNQGMISLTIRDSCISSPVPSLSVPARAAVRDAGMRGRKTYNKVSSMIAQAPRKHATRTALILSSLKPFVSQASELASLTKRRAPHTTESKSKTASIAISVRIKTHLKMLLNGLLSQRLCSYNFGCFSAFLKDYLPKIFEKPETLTARFGWEIIKQDRSAS
jgi:hypothetical protein